MSQFVDYVRSVLAAGAEILDLDQTRASDRLHFEMVLEDVNSAGAAVRRILQGGSLRSEVPE